MVKNIENAILEIIGEVAFASVVQSFLKADKTYPLTKKLFAAMEENGIKTPEELFEKYTLTKRKKSKKYKDCPFCNKDVVNDKGEVVGKYVSPTCEDCCGSGKIEIKPERSKK